MKLENIVAQDLVVSLAQLKGDRELLVQIQQRLSALGWYPGGRWIDGGYGPRTETALAKFCAASSLDSLTTGRFDRAFASALLQLDRAQVLPKAATDRDQVFQDFLRREIGFDAYKLAFLDHSIDKSAYKSHVDSYPSRLKEKPDTPNLTDPTSGPSVPLAKFDFYPVLGKIPAIDDKGLGFLHSDITEACIAIGQFFGGDIRARWLGKNALSNQQFWSVTKIIPILNVVSLANTKYPYIDVDNCMVRDRYTGTPFPFHDLAVDVLTYETKIGSSNSISAAFKRFDTYLGLEKWLKKITGNDQLEFQGMYGEPPFFNWPELFDTKSQQVVLQAAPETPTGENALSAYDLTRIISMLGWHHHIPKPARFPGCQWDSLESVVRAMGKDTARYVDVALEKLGLQDVIKSPIIISKLGFGRSDSRNRTELTYSAFVQFSNQRPKQEGNPPQLISLALTLRGVKALNDANAEATELDARMAAEVTEIIRRALNDELV
ncbi:MAG: hypothetical protein Fur0025_30350 [Oscillatoriaceae cyanobacterium]